MTHLKRLELLRKEIKAAKLNGFVVPMSDEYQNEYVPDSARRIEWLTGFSGSAGTVVVLAKKAAIFVDGRYVLQAKNQVDARSYEQHNIKDTTPAEWLKSNVTAGKIGYDPRLHTQYAVERMRKSLPGIELKPVENPIDKIWQDRPKAPNSQIMIHPLKYAGKSSAEKRKKISTRIKENGADACLITLPDSICWLLNIRGADVEFTPLALSFAIVYKDASVDFYTNPSRIDYGIEKYFSANQVRVRDIKNLEKDLARFKKRTVLMDTENTSAWFFDKLKKSGAEIIRHSDPCIMPKARKNLVEIKGARAAHLRDGVAIVKFLCWLSENSGGGKIDEIYASAMLEKFRAANDFFYSLSFATISGFGSNGAIVHYRANKKTAKKIKGNGLYLIDSGAQYFDGTTDITRTVVIGTPTKEQKENFTRVLKGHIAIARAKFPEGTTGGDLDALARYHLWQAGLDYDHGTGHGVGSFLSVHEGPQRISRRGSATIRAGMIISNEPGYYKTKEYGIRIENLVLVKKSDMKNFLEFETLTKAPIDVNLIEKNMLTAEEKEWLENYHHEVFMKLSPHLNQPEILWLKKAISF